LLASEWAGQIRYQTDSQIQHCVLLACEWAGQIRYQTDSQIQHCVLLGCDWPGQIRCQTASQLQHCVCRAVIGQVKSAVKLSHTFFCLSGPKDHLSTNNQPLFYPM
jgi:hypothetical protein